MPSLFGRRKRDKSHSHPTKIQNTFYKNMREFTAWNPWGVRPDHTKYNDQYIPITGAFVKQFDYPAELKKLIEHSWKSAKASGPRHAGGLIMGGSRAGGATIDLTQKGAPSLLRKGFGRSMAGDYDHIKQFEQVAAYAFRGDTRPPEMIHAAGGFYPPNTRTDDSYVNAIAREFYYYLSRREGLNLAGAEFDAFIREVEEFVRGQYGGDKVKLLAEYQFWRNIMDGEAMHLRRMTNDSFLKGYISGTRDLDIAKAGSTGMLGGTGAGSASFGWVYVLRIKSGFLLKTGIGGITKKEAEIAHLGPVLWQDIVGFAGTAPDMHEIYIRNMLDQTDYPAFKMILGSLSAL